jgi:hypothetical protein
MHLRKVWLLIAVVPAALAVTATGSARLDATDGGSAGKATTLVFGAEQGGGPDWCLNLILDVDCGTFRNVVFHTPVIRGAFLYTPNFTYKPDLISRYTLKLRPMQASGRMPPPCRPLPRPAMCCCHPRDAGGGASSRGSASSRSTATRVGIARIHDRDPSELLERERRFLLRQLRVGCDEEHEGIGHELDELEWSILERKCREREVEPAVLDFDEQVGFPGPLRQRDDGVRDAGAEVPQHRRSDSHADALEHPHARALLTVDEALHLGLGDRQRRKDPFGMAEQEHAVLG